MLLVVSNVRKEFADSIVLDGVDLRIQRGDKVALVGRNGCGKTTLLKVIVREYEPDGGTVNLARGAEIGYLSQMASLDNELTVLQSAEQARGHLVEMKTRLDALLENPSPSMEDLEEISALHEHFHAEGGFSLETDFRVVLTRMGFQDSEFDRQVKYLSGGEKTRLMLARLLLEEPDLIILDEPTNHLDLEATEWLEGWVRAYHGAVLVVSHDREFLRRTVSSVIEMRDGRVKSYPGDFDQYLKLREEDEARLADLAKKQQDQMSKLDEYVRRFMNSQRTAQARGRLKQLEKLQASAVQAPKAEKSMVTSFQVMKRAGDRVYETSGLGHGFGGSNLFEGLDWTVRWGERWGVIGVNGAGKSTLVRLLTGEYPPTNGTIKVGSNVNVGYFSQHADALVSDLSPIEFLHHREGMEIAAARNLLGRFLLSGDDAMRPIRTLSGGERNKVQLAVLTIQHPNVLILDEPTNHLDMASRDALTEVLSEFNGTLILVSHDRTLLTQVTDHTLDMRGGVPIQYGGSYAEYRRSKTTPSTETKAQVQAQAVVASAALSPRELSKEIQRLEKAIADAEDAITATEAKLSALESRMALADPKDDHFAMSKDHAQIQADVEAQLGHWETTAARLEELRALQGSA
ncbi:MAG: ABC-F family ATP-binding cassette domain-containing protein [Chthonomonas sp.]|nr:ABC-F family ATP-binding cassette domain-containing protein [Chthonomonas sp.]